VSREIFRSGSGLRERVDGGISNNKGIIFFFSILINKILYFNWSKVFQQILTILECRAAKMKKKIRAHILDQLKILACSSVPKFAFFFMTVGQLDKDIR
jgi:hypothetical protein